MSHTRALRLAVTGAVLIVAVSAYAAGSFTVNGGITTTAAQTLNPAAGTTQIGTVAAGGSLSVGSGKIAITISGGDGTGTATVSNNGTIAQTDTTRAIRNSAGATTIGITNGSTTNTSAIISSVGDDTIQVSVNTSAFTIDNFGTISAGANRAVNVRDSGSSTITNESTGIMQSSGGDAVRPGANGIINNYGKIQAFPPTVTSGAVIQADTDDGIQADILTATSLPVNGVVVNNYSGALISGRHGITGSGANISDVGNPAADFSITVNNKAGATVSAVNGSGLNIDNVLDGSGNLVSLGNAVVNNDGTILGNFGKAAGYNTGDGDGVDVDGILTLINNGIIRGTGAAGLGSDGGANNPEGVSIGGGSITNNAGAEITGQDTTGSGTKGHGILSDNSSGGNAYAATTITNSGLIRGFDSYAICLVDTFADAITNNAGGVIHGGGAASEGAAIQAGAGADILTNSGSIIADNGLAVDLGAGDDVMHVTGPSASITGSVSGGTGNNTLDIDPGAGNSFTYSGALSNFSSVQIKSGTVTFSGVNTYAGATLVSGGTLVVSNGSGSGTGTGVVTVNSGATLSGTGTVNALTTQSGALIAPGSSVTPGTLNITSALTLAGGSSIRFRVGAASDRVNVGGAFAYSGSGAVIVNIADAGIVAGNDYTLINAGSASGFSSNNVVLGPLPKGINASLQVTGTAVILHAKYNGGGALSLWSALVLGLIGLFATQRKRQAK